MEEWGTTTTKKDTKHIEHKNKTTDVILPYV